MKLMRDVIIIAILTACATAPEVESFNTVKSSSLSVDEVKSVFKEVASERDDLFIDSISDDLIVLSSTNKEVLVACRVGFGDTFRSAKSKFFFTNSNNVWSVRSEHAGRAGIGGNSDVVEFRGVDIPCESTGYIESLIFEKL